MHRPRVSPVDVGAAGVPVALTDAADSAWSTQESTATLLDSLGIEISMQALVTGPVTRCVAAGKAWAWKTGITRPVSWGKGIDLDLSRMRELGIRAGMGGGGEARERLRRLNSG